MRRIEQVHTGWKPTSVLCTHQEFIKLLERFREYPLPTSAQMEGSGFRDAIEQFDRTPFTFDSIQNHSFQKNTQP